jgi:DNA polymerase I
MKINLLCDTKYLLFRSISVNNRIQLTKGGIYYLFFNTLQSVANKFKVDNTIFMLDSKQSHRRKIYPEYKRKDKTINPILEEQLKIINLEYEVIKVIFQHLGFAYYNRIGYEADDLFAFYIHNRPNEKHIILSKDDDLLQLISKNVIIYDPKNKLIKDEKWFKKTYEISPHQWSLYKSLSGCSSDNIKGIPGIGEKYALDYIKEIAPKKIVEKIQSNWDKVDFNLKLTDLPFGGMKIDGSFNHRLKDKQTNLNMNKFIDFCVDMSFKSFLSDLEKFNIFCKK